MNSNPHEKRPKKKFSYETFKDILSTIENADKIDALGESLSSQIKESFSFLRSIKNPIIDSHSKDPSPLVDISKLFPIEIETVPEIQPVSQPDAAMKEPRTTYESHKKEDAMANIDILSSAISEPSSSTVHAWDTKSVFTRKPSEETVIVPHIPDDHLIPGIEQEESLPKKEKLSSKIDELPPIIKEKSEKRSKEKPKLKEKSGDLLEKQFKERQKRLEDLLKGDSSISAKL